MAVAKREKARRQAKTDEQKRRNAEAQAKREVERIGQTTTQTTAVESRLDGPHTSDGVRHFSRADRLELMLLQERYHHAVAKRERATADLEKHEAQYLYQRGRFADAASAAEISKVHAATELAKLHTEIERVYDLSIAEIVFDPDTGAISPAPRKH